MNQIPEILAPAGDWERLEAAVLYGADAVYLGGSDFGMRARAATFDADGLRRAVDYCHARGVKVYVTCNVLPYNREIEALEEFLRYLGQIGADAAIVADVGVLRMAKRVAPEIPVHISTQAGVVNWLCAKELHELGASRVIPARELSLEDIAVIREKTPPTLEIEAFVHGAMCVSFSGRCLISHYLTGRDANHGQCSQPCRWKWRLVEEKRPGEYFPVVEEDGYTYLMNAQDMNMLLHLDKLARAGVNSFKIEGRAKSAYYTAVVTNAYRCAADLLREGSGSYEPPRWLLEEPYKVSHREYCTGFYFPEQPPKEFYSAGYVQNWRVAAVVEDWCDGMLTVSQRSHFRPGERMEILAPGKPPAELVPERLIREDGSEADAARHPMERLCIPCESPFPAGAYIRTDREIDA